MYHLGSILAKFKKIQNGRRSSTIQESWEKVKAFVCPKETTIFIVTFITSSRQVCPFCHVRFPSTGALSALKSTSRKKLSRMGDMTVVNPRNAQKLHPSGQRC